MTRRHFLRSAGAMSASCVIPGATVLRAYAEPSAGWRTFEVQTHVEVLQPSGSTRIWLPSALITETPFQKTLLNEFTAPGGNVRLVESSVDGLRIITAEFPAGVKPVLSVRSRVMTHNYAVDLSRSATPRKRNRAELEYFLRPTKLLPTDGIVNATATQITDGAKTDLEKARAIYEWIVDNSFRNPKTRGCGIGDIRFMLESKNLSGKCADLNALYVGLARAAGIPARDVYGIRVGKSELGYESLGVASANITRAQHCRAEVYIAGYGWVPVDPADVRKVVLEEPPGNLTLRDEKVEKARVRLFGSWEMNWIAYNFAHDVALPESQGPTLGYLMYPQAETKEGRLDSLDPDNFKYEITSREVRLRREK